MWRLFIYWCLKCYKKHFVCLFWSKPFCSTVWKDSLCFSSSCRALIPHIKRYLGWRANASHRIKVHLTVSSRSQLNHMWVWISVGKKLKRAQKHDKPASVWHMKTRSRPVGKHHFPSLLSLRVRTPRRAAAWEPAHVLFRSTSTDGEMSRSVCADKTQPYVEHGRSFPRQNYDFIAVCHSERFGMLLVLCRDYKEGAPAQV